MTERALHIDFETKSACDLPKRNAYVYFDDPTTDLWLAAYAFDDEEPQLWFPGEPCPEEIEDHVRSGGVVEAWNAAFERLAWNKLLGPKYGWPVPLLRQYRCTMARAYAMGLPGKLENAAIALGLAETKDQEGYRLMLKMTKPRAPKKGENGTQLYWHDSPENIRRLGAYCKDDVRAERSAGKRIPLLRPAEQEIWFLDQQINDRGVYVDRHLCEQAIKIVADMKEKLDAEMRQVTDMDVRGISNVAQLIAFTRKHGVDADSVAKDKLAELLVRDDLIPPVRRALEIRQEGAKSSNAKLDKMLDLAQTDGRMRGNLQYHGAGTGRWAGRGAQPQNYPRPIMQGDLTPVIEDIRRGDAEYLEMLYGPPLSTISDCLRGMIAAAPGKKILSADFSMIEARVTAWLAGEQAKLDAFQAYDQKKGADPYVVAAAGIYGVPVSGIGKAKRQIGKVAILSLGFQGGPGAFAAMAKNYQVDVGSVYDSVAASATPENIEKMKKGWTDRGKKSGMSQRRWCAGELIKLAWRDDNPRVVQLWSDIDNAAIKAVEHPGTVVKCGRLMFRKAGSWLLCRLPGGRAIAYAYPSLAEEPLPWGGTKVTLKYFGVDSTTKKWERQTFYGGLGTENVVQGAARDVMAEAMLRVEQRNFPIVLTIHDELVSEADETADLAEFCRLTAVPPKWADGLPIAVDGWEGARYRK